MLLPADVNLCIIELISYRLFKQYLLLFLVNQMASGLFRLIAALGRNMIVSNTFGSFVMLVYMSLGGFIISRGMLLIQLSLDIKVM